MGDHASMDVRFLLLILFSLVSCMPEAQVGRGNVATDGTSTTAGSGSGGDPSTGGLSWNYLGAKAANITINVSNLNNAYLVGTPVETYLSSDSNFIDQDFCLVSTYSLGGSTLELRSRVVPISYYDF